MFASEGTVSRAQGAAVQRPVVGARLLEPAGFGEQGGGQVGRSGWGRGRKCNQRGLRTLRHVVRTRPPLCSDELLTALQRPLQPLPQPRCRNERSRISSSRRHRISPRCQSGKRLETRRMGVPSVRSPGGVCTYLSAGRGEELGSEKVRGRGL